jgi:hypothetical protein
MKRQFLTVPFHHYWSCKDSCLLPCDSHQCQPAYITWLHTHPTHVKPEDGGIIFLQNIVIHQNGYSVTTQIETVLKLHKFGFLYLLSNYQLIKTLHSEGSLLVPLHKHSGSYITWYFSTTQETSKAEQCSVIHIEDTSYVILISGFRSNDDETCGLLGYYAASCGNCLLTFRDSTSVPSSQVKSYSDS